MSNMPVFENPCGAYSRYEIIKHIPLDRLEEICQAEREGRCMVLPCSVGEKIWIIENVFNGKEVVRMLGNRTIDEIKHNKLNKNTMISKRPFELHFYPSEVGKTVFFIREEAEAALKGAEEGERDG